jgi:hypothetical protein
MRPVIFDLEIENAIPDRKSTSMEGVKYCEGWHDHANMGISVLGALDWSLDRPRVFCKDNREEFRSLTTDDSILFVGFNSKRFDAKVVKQSWSMEIRAAYHYDILEEIWLAHNLDPDKFQPRTHGGFGLDAVCAANGMGGKSGNGALAPVDWQRGKIGAVIDYCLHDVYLTSRLFHRIHAGLHIICPKTGRELHLRKPVLPALLPEDSEMAPQSSVGSA